MLSLFLGGDLMTGRGVDQILSHPGSPRLWEAAVNDAGSYVRLAERAHGRVPAPVPDPWPWGEALELLDQYGATIRIANLETSITTHDDAEPGKAVHYRMAPGNVGCLTVSRLDAVTLANNHVLDFGRPGLTETLESLAAAGIATAGAGRTADEAAQPAIVHTSTGGRVVLFGIGSPSSGIPPYWTARSQAPGVTVVADLSRAVAQQIVDRAAAVRRPGDVVVVSIHWGSNWGYDVPPDQVAFARRLVDGGIDVVHGHSSHHPRPIEVYRDRLILYGVGDLIDDYEGIPGYEEYRPDLRVLPIATVDESSGRLDALRLIPVRSRRLSLQRAEAADAKVLGRTLNEISSARFVQTGEGDLELTR